MPTFSETRAGYLNLWNSVDYAHPSMSRGALLNQIDHIIDRGLTGRTAYEKTEQKTGVPWWWILPVHYRESNLNFSTHLHNGDPLTGYTTHVPAGRPHVGHGPPFSWDESAADALDMQQLSLIAAWPPDRALYEWERYNGWGYFGRISSPYVWAWSSHYAGGKITTDHGGISNVYDQQCGCAVIVKRMLERKLFEFKSVPQQTLEIGPLANQDDRPYRYQGTLTLDGVDYPYATGGLNRGSAPYGTWVITPDAIGDIGKRLGAIGIADGEMEDPKYPGAPREGIEIHPGESDSLLRSEGCIVIAPSKFPAFKQALLADIAQKGPHLIEINPDSHIVIFPQNQEPTVATTPPVTPIALPTLPTVDLASVQHVFQMLDQLGITTAISTFYPPAGVGIKLAETVLTTVVSVQQGQSVFSLIPQAMRDLATQIEGLAPKTGA